MTAKHTNQPLGLVLPLDAYALSDEDVTRFAEEQAMGMVSPQAAVLNSIAQPVAVQDIPSPHIQACLQRLLTVAGSQQRHNKQHKKRRTLVGLAAPQIGESLRMIVVDTRITDKRK